VAKKKGNKPLTSHSLDGEAYRKGALERLDDAGHLLRQERLGDAIYLAGRAVEGMLRAVIWYHDKDVREGRKSLETGHQLPQLLESVADLGLLRADLDRDQELRDSVQAIGRRWFNNLRFASTRFVHTLWWAQRIVTEQWTLKQAAHEFYNASSKVIRRCEELCRTTSSRKS
jgi:HEPN domain-containing protein